MLVKLPIVFEVSGRRGKVRRTVQRADWVEAEVPEISLDDTVLAARWTESTDKYSRIDCRAWNGQFYVREHRALSKATFANIGRQASRDLGHARLAELMGLFPNSPQKAIFHDLMCGRVPGDAGFEKVLDEIGSSGDLAQRYRSSALLDAFLLVDGGLWRKIAEPKLKVDAAGHDDPFIASTSVLTSENNRLRTTQLGHYVGRGSSDYDVTFNLGEYDAMASFLTSQGASPAKRVLEVEVLRPDMFAFDSHRMRVIRIAGETCRLARGVAGGLGREAMEAFLEMKELANPHVTPEGAAPEVLLPLVERVLCYIDGLPDYGRLERLLAVMWRLSPDEAPEMDSGHDHGTSVGEARHAR